MAAQDPSHPDDDSVAAPSIVSVDSAGTKVLNCRAIFLRCVEELTLFKSAERNIFILALRHKTAAKKVGRNSTYAVEYT